MFKKKIINPFKNSIHYDVVDKCVRGSTINSPKKYMSSTKRGAFRIWYKGQTPCGFRICLKRK